MCSINDLKESWRQSTQPVDGEEGSHTVLLFLVTRTLDIRCQHGHKRNKERVLWILPESACRFKTSLL